MNKHIRDPKTLTLPYMVFWITHSEEHSEERLIKTDLSFELQTYLQQRTSEKHNNPKVWQVLFN